MHLWWLAVLLGSGCIGRRIILGDDFVDATDKATDVVPQVEETQLTSEGLIQVDIPFTDWMRSVLPRGLGLDFDSIELKLKFSRRVTTTTYMPMSASPVARPVIFFGWEIAAPFPDLGKYLAKQGFIVCMIFLTGASDGYDYTKDFLLVVNEFYAEVNNAASPLFGQANSNMLMMGYGDAAQAAFMTSLKDSFFTNYLFDQNPGAVIKGFVGIGPPANNDGIMAGMQAMTDEHNVLILSGETDCRFPAADNGLLLYGFVGAGSTTTCKIYTEFTGGNSCFFQAMANEPFPPPAGFSSCIDQEYVCGSVPTQTEQRQRDVLFPMLGLWSNHVANDNLTAWAELNVFLEGNLADFYYYLRCIKQGQSYAHSVPGGVAFG